LKRFRHEAMVGSMTSRSFEAIVVGGGPAGFAAACLLAKAGVGCAIIAGREQTKDDPRTVALMAPALNILSDLGLWPGALSGISAPLRKLRLVDDTGSLITAPETIFEALELSLDAFGWNIPLAALIGALRDKAAGLDTEIITHNATRVTARSDHVEIETAAHAHHAPVAIAADGRSSIMREAAHLAMRDWTYDQAAIATSFSHSAPHDDISTEYHRPGGPLTTVPLPGNRSSLVWMDRPAEITQFMALSDRDFATEIQLATHGELGRIGGIGPRRSFPMQGLIAESFARNRIMLVGETAHVVPPIGAQGLNMSMRDAVGAAALVACAKAEGSDPGATERLAEYDRQRRADVLPRQSIIDTMNRSLLLGMLPLDAGRAAGLAALRNFAPLRHFVMRRGLGLELET
jgi:2-octaprenyl-6-methoxyphenol hydroxylase